MKLTDLGYEDAYIAILSDFMTPRDNSGYTE